MKYFLTILIIMVLSSVSVSSARDNATSDLERELHDAFKSISLSHLGLEYPPDNDRLSSCTGGCLEVFNRVMDAKQFIMAQAHAMPEKTLGITLDAIFHYALQIPAASSRPKSPDEGLSESSTCFGAIIALYFFDRDAQDRIIFDRIKSGPPEVLDKLFVLDYEWLHNRPNPERWVVFVDSLPEKNFPAPFKKHIIETLRKKDFKKFGIMLDRPPLYEK